jgi:hypothetical protein
LAGDVPEHSPAHATPLLSHPTADGSIIPGDEAAPALIGERVAAQ